MNTALVYCQRLLFSMLFPNVFLKFKDNFRLPAPFGQKTTRIKGEARGDCGRAAGGRSRTASRAGSARSRTASRRRAFRCLFLHHQTAGRRRASRLAFVIDERAHAGPVVHESGRCAAGGAGPAPTTEWFCILMGLRMWIVCSGRGKPRPYVGNGLARSAAHKKGASHGAPTCLY